jgi:dipeptidyl aminopeptidase/acylaminoacyl peptidase
MANGGNDPNILVQYATTAVNAREGVDEGAILSTKTDVIVLNLETNDIRTLVANTDADHFTLSPDRNFIVFARAQKRIPHSFSAVYDVEILDLRTAKARVILPGIRLFVYSHTPFSWSPDGQFVTALDESDATQPRMISRAVLLANISSGVTTRCKAASTDDLGKSGDAVWSSNGKQVSLIQGNAVETFSIPSLDLVSKVSIPGHELLGIVSTMDRREPSSGESSNSLVVRVRNKENLQEGFWRVWTESRRSVMLVEDNNAFSYYPEFQQFLEDGSSILFVWESVGSMPELYESDLTFKHITRITHLSATLGDKTMGESTIVKWSNRDGRELMGALLLPSNYEPRKHYPMIVSVYPSNVQAVVVNQFGFQFEVVPHMNWQVFATRGYAVFVPNIPTVPSHRMADIANDVLPGVEKLIEMGIVDPDRIGVTGMSDGGYSTLSLLVQSKLFRAAIMISGYGNMLGFYGASGLSQAILEESIGYAPPWENPAAYQVNSPVYYLDRIQNPLLIIIGSADKVVPPALGKEIFMDLRRLNKEAVLVEYVGGDHDPAFNNISYQIDMTDRKIKWFDKYLKGNTPLDTSGSAAENPN